MAVQFEEVINFAIEQEQRAAALYETYAGIVKDQGSRRMLEDIAKMERGHEKKLKKFVETGGDVFVKIGEVSDLHISDYMVEKELTENSSVQDAYIFAMKAEEKAFLLYSRLGAIESDIEKFSLFEQLAEEEKKHKYDLEQEYEKEIMREN